MSELLIASFALLLLGCGGLPSEQSLSTALTRSDSCPELDDVVPGRPRVFFSPYDGPEDRALCLLAAARSEVLVAQYNIRSARVLAQLVALQRRGVYVAVAVDGADAAQSYNTGDDYLEQNGIRVVRTKPAGATAI